MRGRVATWDRPVLGGRGLILLSNAVGVSLSVHACTPNACMRAQSTRRAVLEPREKFNSRTRTRRYGLVAAAAATCIADESLGQVEQLARPLARRGAQHLAREGCRTKPPWPSSTTTSATSSSGKTGAGTDSARSFSDICETTSGISSSSRAHFVRALGSRGSDVRHTSRRRGQAPHGRKRHIVPRP